MSDLMVSIIIPIYNAEKYLTECLDSVKNQSYRNFECIMIDDGSRDGSGKIAREYARRDSRFRYFYQENAGVSAARNHGLCEAVGDYVTFLDSDDSLAQTYFQEYVKRIHESGAEIVCGGYECDGQKTRNYCNENSGRKPFIENVITGTGGVVWSKFFAKGLLENQSFRADLSMREDLIFQLELSRKLQEDVRVTYLENYGYYYRKTESSLSSRKRELDCGKACNVEIVDLMLELAVPEDLVSDYIKKIILWDCIAAVREPKGIQQVTDSLLLEKHRERISIKTFRDRIFFETVKNRKHLAAGFIYRLYAWYLGGKT